MDSSLQKLASRLASARRKGHRLAMLFDYDGTLTPIVEHPSQARLQQRTLRLLERLSLAVDVGIISGRSLDDLQSMVDIPNLYYAGITGLQLDLRGERITHPEVEKYQALMAKVASRLDKLAALFPGAWLEDKRLAVTLHYRRVDASRHKQLLATARETLLDCSALLRVTDVPMALEIMPALDWDKGAAVRQILDAIGDPLPTIFSNSTTHDSEAMAGVVSRGGIAVAVGDAPSASAQYHLLDSNALVSFLEQVDEALARDRFFMHRRSVLAAAS